MRTLVFGVIAGALVALAFVAGDAYFTERLEERLASEVSARLAAPSRVDLRGWPIMLGALRGEIEEVGLDAGGVPLQGSRARLTELHATFPEVPVPLSALTALPSELPLGRPGHFDASLSERDVAALVGVEGLRVRLLADRAEVSVSGIPLVLEATATLESGQIILQTPETIPGLTVRYPVDLPPLPGGAKIEYLRITPGALRLAGSMTSLPLRQP